MKNNLSSWLNWGVGELAFLEAEEARRECEEMLQCVSGMSRAELYLSGQRDPEVFLQFSKWVEARKNRIPLAYLLGKAHFWQDEFEIEEGVFIPRPETEILVEAFLKNGGFARDSEFRFLDLGTGSGNIAVTIAKIFRRARGAASDICEKALRLSARNARRLGVEGRIDFVRAYKLSGFYCQAFDVIFSNPPYVASGDFERLEPEVLAEPSLALNGGERGTDFYEMIFQDLSCLKQGGSLWMEIGWNQCEPVKRIFQDGGFNEIRIFKDLNQIDRVVAGSNRSGTPSSRGAPQGRRGDLRTKIATPRYARLAMT